MPLFAPQPDREDILGLDILCSVAGSIQTFRGHF